MIQKRFGLDIPVFVILQEKLEDILSKAPDWWGTSSPVLPVQGQEHRGNSGYVRGRRL